MQYTYETPEHWLTQRLRVLLLGAGGTGGEVLYALARMNKMLLLIDRPGIHVTVMDGDTVSAFNLARQRFAECDIGHNKAQVLAQRLNLFFMSDWDALGEPWSPKQARMAFAHFDLVITCVDSAKVRVELARAGHNCSNRVHWMDFGNGRYTGQCVLGHLRSKRTDRKALRLPNVYDLYAQELRKTNDKTAPSCSSLEAIRQQDLFVNPLLAEAGVSVLWKMLQTGSTTAHGVTIDVRLPAVDPLLIDTRVWAGSYHYHPHISQREKKKAVRQAVRAAA